MKRETPRSNATQRLPQLNVIYFIDAAKTRSFKMPLKRLKWVIALLLGIAVWSVGSAVLIFWLWTAKLDQFEDLKSTLQALFDYEVRYEQVYETAYPKSGISLAAQSLDEAKLDSSEDNRQLDEQGELPKAELSWSSQSKAGRTQSNGATLSGATPSGATPSGANASATATSAGKKLAARDVTSNPRAAAAKPQTKVFGAIVKDPSVERKAEAFDLTFVLKNVRRPDRVEGYVWAVAKFKGDDGAVRYLTQPDDVQIDQRGAILQPSDGHLFAIRSHKNKSFTFKAPPVKGRFTDLHVGIFDKVMDEQRLAKVNIDLDFTPHKKPAILPESSSESVPDADHNNEPSRSPYDFSASDSRSRENSGGVVETQNNSTDETREQVIKSAVDEKSE